ncbi:hypothetical protein GF354_06255 [Candidatus Peregrinibacteria bacterium]|nr:hypothetical protein [Candidatus Peregrinibacteria bacterium]
MSIKAPDLENLIDPRELAKEIYPEGIDMPKPVEGPASLREKKRPVTSAIINTTADDLRSYYADTASRILGPSDLKHLFESIHNFEQNEKIIDLSTLVELVKQVKINIVAVKKLGWEITEKEAKAYGFSEIMINSLKQGVKALPPTINSSREALAGTEVKVLERENGKPKFVIRNTKQLVALSRLYRNQFGEVTELKTYIFRNGRIIRVEHRSEYPNERKILLPLYKKQVMDTAANTEERCLITNAALAEFGFETKEEYFGRLNASKLGRSVSASEKLKSSGILKSRDKSGIPHTNVPISLLGLKKR